MKYKNYLMKPSPNQAEPKSAKIDNRPSDGAN